MNEKRSIREEADYLLILKELSELCELLSDYAGEKGSIGKRALFKLKAEKFRRIMTEQEAKR